GRTKDGAYAAEPAARRRHRRRAREIAREPASPSAKSGSLSTPSQRARRPRAPRGGAQISRHRRDAKTLRRRARRADHRRLAEATARHRELDLRLQELRRTSAQLGARIASAESALKGFERRRADIEQRTTKLATEKESLELQRIEQTARRDELQRQAEDLR